MLQNLKKLLLVVIPVAVFLLTWEAISRAEVVSPRLFPPPSVVWNALCEWIQSGELWLDVKASVGRVIFGFLLGGGLGIIIGMLTGRIHIFAVAFNPLLQLFRPLPPVAIIPLVIVALSFRSGATILRRVPEKHKWSK